MDVKWIDLAYEISDEIKETSEFKRLLELKNILETSEDLVDMIHTFDKVKRKYEEVNKYGKYHPDLKKTQIELQQIKEQVFTNEVIKEYKKLEKVIQSKLDMVSREIATAVSEQIKHPNEIGLIPKH